MTLKELADFICTKVNLSEANDVAACKTYLRQRRDMIWRDQLWKDALVEYVAAIDPSAEYVANSTYLPTKGILLLPPEIERVMACRTDERNLNIIRQEFLYRIEYNAFGKSGDPIDYKLLPACVWEFDTATASHLVRAEASDSAVVTLDLLDTDGTTVNRSTVTLDDTYKAVTSTERIDAISKAATTGAVALNVYETTEHQVTNNATASFLFSSGPNSVTLAPGETGGLLVRWSTITATEVTGEMVPTYSVTISYPPGAQPTKALAFSFNGTTFTSTGYAYSAILSVPASTTSQPKRQRIQFVEIPTLATTVRVLGKRRPPTFSDDNDEAGLSGIDNALIAFVQADMLQRERQYGKAQAVQAEGMALLDQLKHAETVQQAHHVKIMPDAGYGPDNTAYF